jgi:tRNA(adenine34) deaminase
MMSFDFGKLNHEYFMREALFEAELAGKAGERPIGAVIIHGNRIIGKGRAQHIVRESNVAHAEMNALLQTERYLNKHARDGCVIFTTVEPCVMCLGAIVMSNIAHVVYALPDNWIKPQGMFNMDYVRRHIHNYLGGVLAGESMKLWAQFRPQELTVVLDGKLPNKK